MTTLATARQFVEIFSRPELRDGTCYITRIPELNYVKIGSTKHEDPKTRLKQLSASSPLEHELLATLPGGEALELALHKVFQSYRTRGEWFTYKGDLKKFVLEMAEVK